MRRGLKSLSSLEVESWGRKVQDQIISSDIFKRAKVLALYHPFQNEVETRALFEAARREGKTVAYPAPSDKKEGSLVFYGIEDLADLKGGEGEFLRPVNKGGLKELSLPEIDLMVIPGLAFDKRGNRLGRGKGFYDKTLKHFAGVRVGLAYSFQVTDHIPHAPWDETLHCLVTEEQFIHVP